MRKLLLIIAAVVICVQAVAVGWLVSDRETLKGHVSHRLLLEEFIITRIEVVNAQAPAARIAQAVLNSSEKYRTDPLLVLAIIEQESHYDDKAVGLSGEKGLMQIAKRTAKTLGLDWEDAFTIEANVDAGTRYLATHIKKLGNAPALERYNGGGVGYAKHVLARFKKISGGK